MIRITRRTALKTGSALPFLLGIPSRFGTGGAAAQTAWPSKQVHILIPFGAGGAADTVSRVLFAKLGDKLKQPFVLENKTGGNTMVAASAALQLPKDGNSFLVNSSQVLVNPVLLKNLPFDFATSFEPVIRMAAFPQVIAVRKDFPAKNFAELVAYAKANPGKVGFGTPPAAGMAHMAGAYIQSTLGIKFNHAPYRLATEAVRDVGGGHLDMVILTTSTIQPALQQNSVRILAVTSSKRVASLPDVPTLSENLLPGFSMDDWVGLFAQTGVPVAIIRQMQEAITDAAREKDVIDRLSPLGTVLIPEPATAFRTFLDGQRQLLTKLIKDAGITLE